MPHLILEYSNNLAEPFDAAKLFAGLHAVLVEFPPIKLTDIKSRAIPCDAYYVGDGKPDAVFIHLTVKVFNGKTLDERRRMSQRMLEVIKESFAETLANRPCDITVDICEIERETYGKAASQ